MLVNLLDTAFNAYRICGGNQFASGDCVIRFTADGGLSGFYFYLWRRAVVHDDFHTVADGAAVDVAESGIEVVAALCRCGQLDGAVSLEAVRHALRPEVRQVGHRVGVVEQPDEAVGGVAHDELGVVVPAEVQRAPLEGEDATFHGAERPLGERHLRGVDADLAAFGGAGLSDAVAESRPRQALDGEGAEVVFQRREPLLHGGELGLLQQLGRALRFRLLWGECAHALLSVPDVVDQMAYAAYDKAIHYFCHCSKV